MGSTQAAPPELSEQHIRARAPRDATRVRVLASSKQRIRMLPEFLLEPVDTQIAAMRERLDVAICDEGIALAISEEQTAKNSLSQPAEIGR